MKMINSNKIVGFIKIIFSYFFSLVSSFIGIIDIFLSASDTDEAEVDSKKNSSLAWGNTHDDGWMD